MANKSAKAIKSEASTIQKAFYKTVRLTRGEEKMTIISGKKGTFRDLPNSICKVYDAGISIKVK